MLIFATITSLFIAVRNAKPICNNLVRWQNDLVCIYNLGEIQEDEADFIKVYDINK